jgi:hypothetical protein
MVVAFDYGVEITYPLGESYSTGILMSSGSMMGIIYTIVCGELIENKLK